MNTSRTAAVTAIIAVVAFGAVAASPACSAPPRTASKPSSGAPRPVPVNGKFAGVVTNPIDPRNLTAVPFGDRSHWLQPWRAYLDTPPATRLRNAVGINFNANREDASAVARVLAANGFRRARIEIPWGDISYSNPNTLIRASEWRDKLRALSEARLRPLIVLNTDDGKPTASKPDHLRITTAIDAGTRTVELDPESAAKVVPGRTGFDGRIPAEFLISSISGTTARLARPTPIRVPAGPLPATTLLYEPFSPVTLSDGAANPAGEATMRGWLRYVQTVTDLVRTELGNTAFDVEISNEQTTNSSFYDINRYYEPALFPGRAAEETIVQRTVTWLKDPANRLPGVRVTNGFASQRPWDSAATSPAGLDALSKHYYPKYFKFPSFPMLRVRPIDALGNVAGAPTRLGWFDFHNPEYATFFPEHSLTAISTESLIRDLAPITTRFAGLQGRTSPHGRHVRNAVGGRTEFWMTEINLETGVARDSAGLTPDDEAHLRAKSALRTLTSYVNKGVTQIDFFAAGWAPWSLIGNEFWNKLNSSRQYPGDASGGPTLTGIRRLTEALGAERITARRNLRLASIADYAGRRQFNGDGSAAQPALYDRDVLAFLPFQASDTRFVVPVYVMTRNMAKLQNAALDADDPRRFDLPAERYQLTVGGVNSSTARVSATDPMTGAPVPVDVVRRAANGWLVVELPVTDSPRLLVIDDA